MYYGVGNSSQTATTTSTSGTYSAGQTAYASTSSNICWNANNTTYVATWLPHTYTVNYNGNGNTGGSTNSSTHTYDVAKNLTTNGFIRSYNVTYNYNYSGSTNKTVAVASIFKNWNTQVSGNGTSYTNGQSVKNLTTVNGGQVNLYAQWNAGSVKLDTPTRIGYTFEGWYSRSDRWNFNW